MKRMEAGLLHPFPAAGPRRPATAQEEKEGPRIGYQRLAYTAEILSWGDAGLYLCTPAGMLGAAAVSATGTPEQKERFLSIHRREAGVRRHGHDRATRRFGHAGRDADDGRPRRRQLGDQRREDLRHRRAQGPGRLAGVHRRLGDDRSDGWPRRRATLRRRGRDAGLQRDQARAQARHPPPATPPPSSCRIAASRLGNILGSPEIQVKTTEGFKGAMATFDASRPLVAASALGVARATLESLKDFVQQKGITIRYGLRAAG